MSRGIAWRRAKMAHIKKRYLGWWQYASTPVQQGIAAHTPKRCSCWMCGNPRKFTGERTVQESRLIQQATDDLECFLGFQ